MQGRKSSIVLAAFSTLGICVLAATHAFASPGESEAPVKIPSSSAEIFEAIHSQHAQLTTAVRDKQLQDVHHHAFAIRDLANALPAKAEADNVKQVEGTAKNIAKLAGDLDESGDSSDQAKTEANLKRMDGMLVVLDAQFGMKPGEAEHKH